MPYNNSSSLTDKEFYTGVSRFLGVTPSTAKRYLEDGFYEFIIRELITKQSCRIPLLGMIKLEYKEGGISTQMKNGEQVMYEIPARYLPIFVPHDIMVNDVNIHGVTKKFRKRQKNNQLNEADYRRQLRRKEMCLDEEDAVETYRQLMEKKKEKFREDLERKVSESKDNGKRE